MSEKKDDKKKGKVVQGPITVEETAVPTKYVSDIKKGLVKTKDVGAYLKKLKLAESQKKKEKES